MADGLNFTVRSAADVSFIVFFAVSLTIVTHFKWLRA